MLKFLQVGSSISFIMVIQSREYKKHIASSIFLSFSINLTSPLISPVSPNHILEYLQVEDLLSSLV